MNLNLEDITFIIVTYKSESFIHECINTLPKVSKKIIIENSGNIGLQKELKRKYDNIEVILSNNVGMGAGNNIGLKSCRTNFAYVLNPDIKLKKDTLKNLISALSEVKDFSLVSPINDDPKIPNYKLLSPKQNENDLLSVDSIDGFSMLFNLKNFPDKIFFDENFFLYLENDDLCLRIKKKNHNIFIIKNSQINHKGSISRNKDLELLRNWHWMWSKYYFNKKHYGTLNALTKVSLNFLSAIFKYFLNLIILNNYRRKIYKMRILGLYNSIIGKKSWYRLE
tara:strand:+ start:1609 stop:2451 length:843 start_codon:yes stop_codon:yes gene_type:complete